MNKQTNNKMNHRIHHPELSVILLDEELRDKFTAKGRLKIYKSLKSQNLVAHKNIFVVSKATGLPKLSDFIREANRRNHLKALLIRPDVKNGIIPKMMAAANVRSLRNTILFEGPVLVKRILNAWEINAQDQLIADASVNKDTLYVISCSLRMYSVPFNKIPALKKIDDAFRTNFIIAEDGRYIHWAKDDIHLDIETLEYHTNERYRKESDTKKLQYHRNLGAAIKAIRQDSGIQQSDIPGLSARQLRRIENGETTVTTKALGKIASGHNMTLEEYLDLIAIRISYEKV